MKIQDLKSNPKNPRKISPESLKALKQSLKKFGDLSGVVYNKTTNQLVGGHQRVKIFQEVNPEIQWFDENTGYFEYEGNRFTYREVEWSEAKEAQANLTANNPDIQGVFDLQLLPEVLELAKLEEGFGELELQSLENLIGTKEVEEIGEDEMPEPPLNPISQLGDIWELKAGNSIHRIVCGSSTDYKNLEEVNIPIDLVFTDPPYGVDITRASKGSSINNGKYVEIANDKTTETAQEFYDNCLALGIDKIILWGGNYFTDFLPSTRCWIVWDKKTPKGMSFARGEMAWTNFDKNMEIYDQLWMGNLVGKMNADNEAISIETINGSIRANRVHPTQKPVTMQAQIIEDFVPEAKNVLDGFLGGGSMLIACQATNRNCYGFELIPAYVDVAITRWINYCAKKNLPTEVRRNGELFNFEANYV